MNNKEKHTGVSFHKSTNKWRATISYDKKQYHLGYFSEKQDAIMIRQLAEKKANEGIFLEWYNDYKSQKNSSKSPKGICFVKNTDKWMAYISYNKKQYILGCFDSMNEAIKTREIAENKIEDGSFLEWYNDYKMNKKTNPYRKGKGVFFFKKRKKWIAIISYNKKQYRLGYFSEKQDAIMIRQLAEKKANEGIFLEWYNDYKSQKMSSNSSLGVAFYKQTNKWRAYIAYNKKRYFLGYFDKKEDAIDIRKIAEQKIKDGEFESWFNDYKLEKNSENIPGVFFFKQTNKWISYISLNKKRYNLGSYEKKENAIETRKIAEQKIKDGKFESWYTLLVEKNKQKKDRKSKQVKQKKDRKSKQAKQKKDKKITRSIDTKENRIYKYKGQFNIFVIVNKKQYRFGQFEDRKEAERIQQLAKQKIDAGEFEEWFNSLDVKNKAIKDNNTIQKNDSLRYIHRDKKNGKWEVTITFGTEQYYIGKFKKIDDAINIRNLAEQKYKDGEFESWYNLLLEERELSRKNYLYYYPKQKRWIAEIAFSKKKCYLGSFVNKEDAIMIQQLAEQKIKEKKFIEWYKDYKEKLRKQRNKSGHIGIHSCKNQQWRAEIIHKKQKYILGMFYTIDEAINIREIAKKKIKDGDFMKWYDNYVKR